MTQTGALSAGSNIGIGTPRPDAALPVAGVEAVGRQGDVVSTGNPQRSPGAISFRRPAFKIGVMGSAAGDNAANTDALARMARLGEAIADANCALVTGACPGLPHAAAMACYQKGGFTMGVSPADSEYQHVHEYHSPTDGYCLIQYTGLGLMQRDVQNIRTCDAVIFGGGRTGTLNEFTIAWKEGKPIGVLTGTGGVSDHLKEIIAMAGEKERPNMVFSSDPEELVSKLIEVARKYPASVHVDGFVTDGIIPGSLPEATHDRG